jgi:hypothetical protein
MFLVGGLPLGAQESKSGKSQDTKSKQSKADDTPSKKGRTRSAPPDPTHRVPSGYAKLGLTPQQKEAMYKIQGKYYPRIQALEKQIDELRSKRDSECEAILTPTQKKLLQQQGEQRKAAAAARKEAAALLLDQPGNAVTPR